MECHDVEPLLAAYALGALDGAEKDSVEEHLQGCPSCQADLEEERRVVQQLPYVTTLVDPPADLKDRVMARIDALEAQQAWEEAAPRAGGPLFRRGWPRIIFDRPIHSLALSVTVVAVVLVGWSVFQTVRVNDLQDRNDELATSVEGQAVQVDALQDGNNQLTATVRNQWRALAMATNPKVESVSFQGTAASPKTTGSLLVNAEDDQAIIMVVDLEPPPVGEVYRIWMWDSDGTMFAVGNFRTWGEGYGMWTFRQPVFSMMYQYFGVSREPVAGSSAPTTPLLIRQENPLASR